MFAEFLLFLLVFPGLHAGVGLTVFIVGFSCYLFYFTIPSFGAG